MSPQNSVMDQDIPDSDILLEDVSTHGTEKERPKSVVVWRNVILMSTLHLSALYSVTLIPKAHPFTWLWCVFVYLLSALGITAGAHRLWSHRSYKAKAPLRILLAFMQTSAFQNDIFDWVRDHRVHHKYSETNADPHNARRGFFFSHVGWLLVKKHPDVKTKGQHLDMTDLYADKVVMLQRRYYKPLVILMCFIVPMVVPWYLWGESLWTAFYLASVLRYALVLNATWLVNSAAHMWGNKPYDKYINPVQNLGVTVCAAGEGFHNYHHVFPQDYSTSEYGWHMNLTTMFIDFMSYLGQVTDRKKISSDLIQKRKERTGDHTE